MFLNLGLLYSTIFLVQLIMGNCYMGNAMPAPD